MLFRWYASLCLQSFCALLWNTAKVKCDKRDAWQTDQLQYESVSLKKTVFATGKNGIRTRMWGSESECIGDVWSTFRLACCSCLFTLKCFFTMFSKSTSLVRYIRRWVKNPKICPHVVHTDIVTLHGSTFATTVQNVDKWLTRFNNNDFS